MKSADQVFQKFEKILNQWMTAIDSYSEEQFKLKPADDVWSVGQLYNHLINSALNFHLKQIEICADGKGTVTVGGKKFPGKVSYLLGTLPPVRIKVPPSPEYTPKQPTNTEEVKQKLQEVLISVGNVRKKVNSAALNIKTAHPGFGFLNAREWYQLIEMHYRHHLRQKKRLDIFLRLR